MADKELQFLRLPVAELVPYARNAKKHPPKQVEAVANCIREVGFLNPVLVNARHEITSGHCRVLAAKKLGMETIPCLIEDYLTEEQRRLYIIADNKLAESEWDEALVNAELAELNLAGFDVALTGFELPELGAAEPSEQDEYERRKQEFEERMAAGELSEDDEEYQAFVAKFEPKKTTDDCYTPPLVYEAVAGYVAERYGLNKADFVRPFVPQGDYQRETYKPTDVVVDNPPFSIFAEIVRFYSENNIRFFLFAPHLTLFSSATQFCSCLCCGVQVIYENGANVSTSFVTNLENCAFRSAPDLYARVSAANDENLKQTKTELPKYSYPMHVMTASMLHGFSRLGIDFEVQRSECSFTRQLDAQKKSGKAIFGSGFLISDQKAAEREKAEREKAEREKAEREKAEREKAERWELSERELAIIAGLGCSDG